MVAADQQTDARAGAQGLTRGGRRSSRRKRMNAIAKEWGESGTWEGRRGREARRKAGRVGVGYICERRAGKFAVGLAASKGTGRRVPTSIRAKRSSAGASLDPCPMACWNSARCVSPSQQRLARPRRSSSVARSQPCDPLALPDYSVRHRAMSPALGDVSDRVWCSMAGAVRRAKHTSVETDGGERGATLLRRYVSLAHHTKRGNLYDRSRRCFLHSIQSGHDDQHMTAWATGQPSEPSHLPNPLDDTHTRRARVEFT